MSNLCRLRYLALILALAGAVRAAGAGREPEAPKARARQALATRAVARRALDLLAAQETPAPAELTELPGVLAEHMLAQPTGFRQVAAGRVAAEEFLEQWRREEFMRRMQAALERAAEQSPLPLSLPEALRQADPGWAERRDTGARVFARTAIAEVYAPARRRAVERQRVDIMQGRVYPDYTELDRHIMALDEQRADACAPLDASAFERLQLPPPAPSVAGPVFEELDNFLDTQASEWRMEIYRQYQRQVAAVGDDPRGGEFPAALLTAAELRAWLDARLEVELTPRPGDHPPLYPVFTAVRAWAEDLAVCRERFLLERFLDRSRREWAPSTAEISTLIKENLPAHADPDRSATLLAAGWAKHAQRGMLELYLGGALPEKAEALRVYFDEALTAGGLQPVWLAAVQAALESQLPVVRADLAREQLKLHFAGLLKARNLPEPVIEYLHDQGLLRAEDTDQALAALAADSDLAPRALERAALLEETARQMREEFNQRVQGGPAALGAQLILVRELEQDWIERLQEDVAAGVPLEQLRRTWSEEWAKRWRAQPDVPSAWRAPFARTRDQLEKTVRQLYSAAAAAEQAATAAPGTGPASSAELTAVDDPPQKPGRTPAPDDAEANGAGGDRGAQGLREELSRFQGAADGILAFSDLPDGRSRLLFGAPDTDEALSLEFDPADVAASAALIAGVLREPLRRVLESGAASPRRGFLFFRRTRAGELRMLFRVDSPSVRHQMSIMLRRLLEEEIARWAAAAGRPPPVLLWQEESGD